MKLEGSLDAFSLPDIFQLLSFTKKSGGLHLAATQGQPRDGVVFFATGQITGASSDSSRQPLARRVVGTGGVDDDAIRAAVAAAQNGSGSGVVRALLDAGAVDADRLRQAATEQTVDAVFDLLRWKDGDFAFVMDEDNADDVGVRLSIEQVLTETEARRESWERVSAVIPTPDAVLAMPVVLPGDPAVSRDEWALLALIDGRRSVADLVDLTGSGQYAVVATLAGLVARGLLEVRGAAGEDDHVAVVQRRQALLAPLERFAPVQAPDRRTPDAAPAAEEPEPAASGAPSGPQMLGGAHVPEDVVPPRPEPFLPRRQADFAEAPAAPESRRAVPVPHNPTAGIGDVMTSTTATAPALDGPSIIERDPSVNRSLMLRLIAGVRGL